MPEADLSDVLLSFCSTRLFFTWAPAIAVGSFTSEFQSAVSEADNSAFTSPSKLADKRSAENRILGSSCSTTAVLDLTRFVSFFFVVN